MKLICLIRGHRWHSLTRTCTRCHQPNEMLMLVDALSSAFTTARPVLNVVNEYLTRLIAEQWSTGVKPTLEVLQTLTEEEQAMLEVARTLPRVRAALPPRYAAMLDAEEEELSALQPE